MNNTLDIREAIAIFLGVGVVAFFFASFYLGSMLNPGEPVTSQNTAAVASALGATQITDGPQELVIEDVRTGLGDVVATQGSRVTVHYIGTLPDGTPFDSSIERGEPIEFTIGATDVIEGFSTGMIGMKEGGKRVIVIPPALAYGPQGSEMVPPNSAVVYTVEVIDIE